MTIKELEERLQIPRANIRFYEKEGFFNPERQANGYRKYSEADVEVLERILFFRKIGISIPEIKKILDGEVPLSEVIAQNISQLETTMKELQGALQICRTMETDEDIDSAFDFYKYQNMVVSEEEKGNQFLDYARDYLLFEQNTFFSMFSNVFLIDLQEIVQKRGTWIGIAAVLAICFIRGMAEQVLWKTGSFLHGFMYPFELFAIITVITLPIYVISKYYQDMNFDPNLEADHTSKIPLLGLWKVLGGLCLFLMILIGVPFLIGLIYVSVIGQNKIFIITGNASILYYMIGMYFFIVVLWIYSKNGVFGNLLTGEKGLKAHLPKKQRRNILIWTGMAFAITVIIYGSWFTCITDDGIQLRRFFWTKTYSWETADSYRLRAAFDGTLREIITFEDGTQIEILGGNSSSNIDEQQHPDGTNEYILAITARLDRNGVHFNDENWDEMIKGLKYEYWKEYAGKIKGYAHT